ncbi:MAG: apolipoprotein N-acyltransferase [Candidatus Margulisiibacteriota bacterium]
MRDVTVGKMSAPLAIISGILLALSYPLFNFWPLAWIALIPLFYALENSNIGQSFLLGWLAGLVMFIGQIFWLKVFHLSIPFIVSAYLGLYFGLFCLFYRLIADRTKNLNLLIAPILWTLIEYVRSIGPWGFPAGILGYSQHLNIYLIQVADKIGVFGISFIIVLVNISIFLAIKERSRIAAVQFSAVAAILVICFVYGFAKVSMADTKGDFRLALIQPGIDFRAEKGYNPDRSLVVLEDLTKQAAAQKPDLIVWPETVITESIRLNPALARKMYKIVNEAGTYFLIGNGDIKNVGGRIKHYNSAFLISPKGEVLSQYNKIHPVPFWEVLPLRYYVGFLKNVEGKGVCDPGSAYTVFETPKGKFSALICFEGMFPDLSKRFVSSGAQFLVNISNDSWSQSRTEHYQHASMNVFRAIENGVYYIRVGNSGVTKVIDPYGRIVKSLPIYKKGYLIADIKVGKF